MYAIGYMPDSDYPDERDKDAKDILTADTHDSATLSHWVVEVLNQRNLGSCVANAGFQAIRMSQRCQNVAVIPPLGSRLFGYYNPRTYHDAEDDDNGTYIRFFFKALNKFGFCPESKYPYYTDKFADKPDHGIYRAAIDQKDPTDYYRIRGTGDDRIEAIKKAITQGHPVVFGTTVTGKFCRGDADGIIPRPTGGYRGGHAMVVEGFNDAEEYCVILNSWGSGFGDGGRCKFSYDYMTWSRTSDLWVVRSAPSYSE